MTQPEILVALDDDHAPGNEVGPCYGGPRDQPAPSGPSNSSPMG